MSADELERSLLRHPKLAPLFDLWNRKRGDRAMPARHDIDTMELQEWLGHLILVDVADAGSYRYRVYGTKLVELFGQELTGKTVGHFASARQPLIHGDFERVRRDRAPILFDRPVVTRSGYARVQILALPLAADGAKVNKILAAVYASQDAGSPRLTSDARARS